MADISMCVNDKCERRETCCRYRVVRNEWHQSYSHYVGGAQCIDWLPIGDKAVGDET